MKDTFFWEPMSMFEKNQLCYVREVLDRINKRITFESTYSHSRAILHLNHTKQDVVELISRLTEGN